MRAAIFALCCLALWPQTPAPKPVFESAAIKLDPQADGADASRTPGMLRSQMTLKHYMMYAYGVQPEELAGGPDWMDREHYAIVAKMEKTGAAATPTAAETKIALQDLLAKRFQLKFHRESRELSVYALTVARSGFKLQAVPDEGGHTTDSSGSRERKLNAIRLNMGGFAAFLGQQVDRPVTDRTELPGVYTFTLEWSPDDLKVSSAERPPLPSIFTALQEQLGLKLEARRGPVDVMVVDSAERPSEN